MAVQDRPWAPRPEEEVESTSWFTPQRIRLILIASVLAVVGTAAYLLIKGARDDEVASRWDKFAGIRAEFEQDAAAQMDWRDTQGTQSASRARYISALELFLKEEAKGGEDALEPQVRWLISRLARDQVLSLQGVVDVERRTALYEKALEHISVIEKDFPDYPLNWSAFKPKGYPTVARKDREWVKANLEWEKANLPREMAPDSAETLVFRTTRGDIHMKAYAEAAPTLSKMLIEKARNGDFDGTMIFERREVGRENEPQESSLRAGAAASRGAKPYDAKGHLDFVKGEDGGGMLPESTRHKVPFTRGIVAAWHEPSTSYDKIDELLFVTGRSPSLDYTFTPLGKVLDDESLAVLDAIFGQSTWEEDPEVRADTETRGVLDMLQAPIKIEKVLVYGADGSLMGPAGAASKVRAVPTANEKSLSSLSRDAYKVDVPEREGTDDSGEGDGDSEGGTDGAGSSDSDG